jgi:hypothetical protein
VTTNQWIVVVGLVATIAGSAGGLLEVACKPGSVGYRVGVVLASLGVDLSSLSKAGGA